MTTRRPSRVGYVMLALLTIGVGLWVHRSGVVIDPDARDMLGDALWAMMITWWIGAMAPQAPLARRGAIALGICVAVELSQLIHAPAIDAVRSTTLGHLVLGSGFDPRDLLLYAVGVSLAVLIEWCGRRLGRGTSSLG